MEQDNAGTVRVERVVRRMDRYRDTYDGMELDPEGWWVAWNDVELILKERDALREALLLLDERDRSEHCACGSEGCQAVVEAWEAADRALGRA